MASDGAIWFTDLTYGISDPREGYPAEPSLARQSVCRWLDGEGVRRMIDLEQPTGLCFQSRRTHPVRGRIECRRAPPRRRGQLGGASLGAPHFFAGVDAGVPDGFAVDSRDWLWISSEAGVVVFDDERGRRLGVIPTPHVASNCTFDTDERRLFITGDSDLWMFDLA